MVNKTKFMMIALCLPFFTSCKMPNQVSQTKTVVLESDDKLWDKLNLNICWLNQAEDTRRFRQKVEEFVTNNFDQTILKLTGWKACSSQPNDNIDIRLLVFDGSDSPFYGKPVAQGTGHPRVMGFAKQLRQTAPGIVLTMNYTGVFGFLSDIANKLNPEGKLNLSLSVSLHEFGHAVGLYHENTHPDSDCIDSPEPQPKRAVTDFVPDSFMNRCFYRRANYSAGPLPMSQGDIDGINKAYNFLLKK